jgi:predicted dinucleotide-binding enzyme
MKIAEEGAGTVGRTIAAKLAELGHEVVVGTRDPESTLARTEPDAMGNPPYSIWQGEHPDIRLAPYAEAAAGGELLVNATGGGGWLEALGLAGGANLAGRVLLDVSNPLDFSRGFPPSLFVSDTDSLAEQIQSGDDPDAKETVLDLLSTMGHTDVIDLGDLSTARAAEMLLPVWLRLMGALGTPYLQFKIVS